MIILSVGMPRAGSGWYYNLTNDVALAAGYVDARQIRRQYHLQGILTEVNCNIGALTPRRLLLTFIPALLGKRFVIKAHAGPTSIARWMIRRGALRAAYIFRDPRDAMLSAYENGQTAIQNGRPNAFSHLVDFQAALDFMLDYVKIWEKWIACPQVLHTRYESLRDDYDTEAQRLMDFLCFPSTPAVTAVIDQYRPQAVTPEQKGLHFRKGKTGRYRGAWTPEQLLVLESTFAPYLPKMGYET
jgi:hypothetical protein